MCVFKIKFTPIIPDLKRGEIGFLIIAFWCALTLYADFSDTIQFIFSLVIVYSVKGLVAFGYYFSTIKRN